MVDFPTGEDLKEAAAQAKQRSLEAAAAKARATADALDAAARASSPQGSSDPMLPDLRPGCY